MTSHFCPSRHYFGQYGAGGRFGAYSFRREAGVQIDPFLNPSFQNPHQENTNNVAGCLFEDKNAVPNSSNMLMYFDVDGRIKDAVEQVTQNHGKVVNNIEAIGPWGYRAIVCDCEGNKIALWSRTA